MDSIWTGISIPPAPALNEVATGAADRQLSVAGERRVIPLTYGEDRIGGLLRNVLSHGTDGTLLIVQVLWGHMVDSINDLKLNDQDLPAGSSVTHYRGDQIAQDAEMFFAMQAQGISYTATLAGFAYSVIKIPKKAFTGQLNFTARIRGRRVYDPAKDSTAGGTGAHRLADPTTWEWSDVPALAQADWTSNKVYGAGLPVLWSSVAAVASANSAMVGSGTTERRRVLGLTLNTAADVATLGEAMRAYAGCWAIPTSAGVRFIPDADASAVDDIEHAAGDIITMTPLTIRDVVSAPTAVEVIFTDTTKVPYRDGSAIAQLPGAGSTRPLRLSQVRMPGVTRFSQAMREAIERLNKLTLGDMSTTVDVWAEGIQYDRADIVRLSHPLGLTLKPMRIINAVMNAPGRWRLQLQEHDPAAYSSTVQTQPSIPDTSFNNPAGPPAQVTGLSASVSTLLITLSRTPTTDVAFRYTAWEYSTNGGGTYNPIPAVAINDGRAGATWQTSIQGALRIRARDVDRDGVPGPWSLAYDFTVGPEIQPGVGTSSTLAIKINTADFAGPTNYNEAYVHGFDTGGAAADVDGSIRVNGVVVTVPKGPMYGGQGPVSCVIVWDNGGPGFSTTIPAVRPYVIARKYNGQWQYDNNAAWTTFTPTASHYVIGQIEVGGVDTGAPGTPPGIVVATMLSDAQLLSSIPGDSVLLNPGDALNSDPYCLDQSKWEHVLSSGSPVQFLEGANSPGTKGSAYMTAFGAGERWEFDNRPTPVDPGRTYNFSANLFAASGNNRNMYLVVRMFRANGSELGGAETGWGGTFSGYTYGGLPATDQFTICGADFGAGTSRPIPSDVVSVRVGVWFQYSSGSSAVQQAAQYVRLTDVTAARAASAAAAAAQTAANNAQSSANTALGTLNAMRSNGILDAGEKPALIREFSAINGESSGINSQADTYGVTTEKNTYNAALVALANYLSSLSPSWNDTTQDTIIVPATDQARWLDFYTARQALLNKIADAAGKVANWTGVSSRPSTYRVGAYGLSATGMPISSELRDADTNGLFVSGAPMYRVVKIHRTTKVVTDLGSFNPLSGAGGAVAQCNAMAAVLNGIDSAHICVVFTYDEPATNRRLGDLPAAMYRNGASRAVWGSDAFQYRGAYILVGIGGCGEGNGAENYAGASVADVNAWCDTTFQITATGALVVSGATRGATTLLDYGYVGTNDATTNKTYAQEGDPAVSPGGVVDGAFWRVPSTGRWFQRDAGAWRPYVAPGTVGTDELVNEAATALRSSTNSSAVNLLSDATAGFTLGSLIYTAPANCTVALRLNGVIEHFSGYGHPSGISSAFGSYAQIVTDGSYLPTGNVGTGDTTMSYNAASLDPYANVPIYLEKRFAMTAGQTLSFFARARVGGITNGSGGSSPGAVCNVRAGAIFLLEVIKK